MQTDQFRRWLAERGCTFEQTERGRDGRGHADMVVRREGRRADFPAAGAHEDLDPDVILRVVKELELDWADLPGPAGRA